ncbi:MAG: isoprenyl transferase [Bacteroidales bacterium]|nr:isoprenyl transferase [Bacteroidales bacterium]MCF8454411.1 isoprenyl transferase [Bacteroidales bacterium]
MENYKDQINKDKLPCHVAIIMDGNGRWAKERGRPRVYGHKKGADSVRRVVEASAELGIGYLTLYTFSKENWNRSENEVSSLMSLLLSTINTETKTLIKNNVRLLAIGDLENLPKNVYKKLMEAIRITADNTGLNLVLALSYGSRWEIINTVKKISEKVSNKEISVDDIDDNYFSSQLLTTGFPDPELLIRTSGETRISNFLLWQIAYSELFFSPKFWPDYQKEDLYQAIVDFQHRERRFGKTSEQLNSQSDNAQ